MRPLKLGAYGGLLLTFAGVAAGLATHSSHAQSAATQAPDTIHLRRLDIVDTTKPNAHVWMISGQDWGCYGSLGSRQLRASFIHQRPGTGVWLDTSPAAVTYLGRPDPDAAEVKSFSTFCTAHGLRFAYSPVS